MQMVGHKSILIYFQCRVDGRNFPESSFDRLPERCCLDIGAACSTDWQSVITGKMTKRWHLGVFHECDMIAASTTIIMPLSAVVFAHDD